jgi:outer membrane protein assembly factor BamB
VLLGAFLTDEEGPRFALSDSERAAVGDVYAGIAKKDPMKLLRLHAASMNQVFPNRALVGSLIDAVGDDAILRGGSSCQPQIPLGWYANYQLFGSVAVGFRKDSDLTMEDWFENRERYAKLWKKWWSENEKFTYFIEGGGEVRGPAMAVNPRAKFFGADVDPFTGLPRVARVRVAVVNHRPAERDSEIHVAGKSIVHTFGGGADIFDPVTLRRTGSVFLRDQDIVSAVAGEGVVVAASKDGKLCCLEIKEDKVRWTLDRTDASILKIDKDRVWVAGGGRIEKIDLDDGDVDAALEIDSTPVRIHDVEGDRAIVGVDMSAFWVVDLTAMKILQKLQTAEKRRGDPSLLADRVLLAGHENSNAVECRGIADGSAWTSQRLGGDPARFDGDADLAFATTWSDEYACWDAKTGEEKWRGKIRNTIHAIVAMGPRGLCLFTDDEEMVLVGADGTVAARQMLHGTVYTAWRISDTSVLASDDRGRLYRIDLTD